MPIWPGFLWTLPNTLLGLVLGILTFQKPRLHHGVVISIALPEGSRHCCRVSVAPR